MYGVMLKSVKTCHCPLQYPLAFCIFHQKVIALTFFVAFIRYNFLLCAVVFNLEDHRGALKCTLCPPPYSFLSAVGCSLVCPCSELLLCIFSQHIIAFLGVWFCLCKAKETIFVQNSSAVQAAVFRNRSIRLRVTDKENFK